MDFMIREYAVQDRDALEQCMQGLQRHLVAVDPLHREILPEDYGRQYVETLLLPILAELEGKMFVAEREGAVAGVIAGTIEPPSKDPGVMRTKTGCVRELYVAEEHRRQGIAQKLMDTMERHFKNNGCEAVMLEVFAPNQLARAFYEKVGYVDRDIKMLKLLA